MKNIPAGEIPVLTLEEAKIFEGVVWLGKSDVPASKARVSISSSQQERGGSGVRVEGLTDDQGRFRLNPYPGVRFGITAHPPRGTPYFIRELIDLKWEPGATTRKIEIRLAAGLLAEGKVIDAETGMPLAKASVQYYPDRTHLKSIPTEVVTGWQSIQLTDDNGNFEIPVAAVPGTLLFHAPAGSNYILRQITANELNSKSPGGRRNYAHGIQKIEPLTSEPNQQQTNLNPNLEKTISLQPGGLVSANVVDAKGQAATDAIWTSRLQIYPMSPFWRASSEPATGGRAILRGLEPGVKYPVFFLDVKRNLGAMMEVSLDDPNPTVVLVPCSSAKARYLTPDGLPVRQGLLFGIEMVATPGESKYSIEAAQQGLLTADEDFSVNFARDKSGINEKTNDQGIVEYRLLVPGATYRLHNRNAEDKWIVQKEFIAKSGEIHDLGDITVDVK